MSVSILNKADEPLWRGYVEKSPQATVYHTLEWRDVAAGVFGHRPVYLMVKNSAGEITGVLPLFYVGGVFGRRLVSVPLRDRGGPLFDSEETLVDLLGQARKVAIEEGCQYLEIRTVDGLPHIVETNLGFRCQEDLIISVVPLPAQADRAWESFKSPVRRAVKKARKHGVTVRWGEGLDDLGEFYTIFLQTRKRLGIPPFSFALFRAIQNTMQSNNQARFILAEYNGRTVGGRIVFTFDDRIYDAYAAADERYRDLRLDDLTTWEVLCWGCDNGFRYFDLSAISPRLKGLLRFKAKWGSQQYRVPYYYYLHNLEEVPRFDSNSPRYRMLRKAWQRVPICVARIIGPYLARQIS